MISHATLATSRPSTARPPQTRPEMVWTVCETADGGAILVARWSFPGEESGAHSRAA